MVGVRDDEDVQAICGRAPNKDAGIQELVAEASKYFKTTYNLDSSSLYFSVKDAKYKQDPGEELPDIRLDGEDKSVALQARRLLWKALADETTIGAEPDVFNALNAHRGDQEINAIAKDTALLLAYKADIGEKPRSQPEQSEAPQHSYARLDALLPYQMNKLIDAIGAQRAPEQGK